MNTSVTEASPYQAPENELLTDSDAVGEVRFFSYQCRIGRLRYLAHSMLLMVVSYLAIAVVGILAAVVGGAVGSTSVASVFVVLLLLVGYVGLLYVSVIMMIQRLHDQDLTGWLCLLMFIPIANLVLAVLLLFVPGTQGANRFGPPPPPNKTWHWILAFAMPIGLVFIMGILAAVAIPAYQDYVERAQSQLGYEILIEPSSSQLNLG